MDDNFDVQKHGMKVTKVDLSSIKEVSLIRGFEIDLDKKYMRFIALKIGNKIITDKLDKLTLFKEELAQFDGSLEENTYLIKVNKEIKNQTIKSMKFSLSKRRNIYFSRAEARAIISLWNMSFQGYSFARLLETPTKQSSDSWSKYLLNYGYLDKKRGQ